MGAETSRQESQVLAVGQTARVIVVMGTLLTCLPVFNVDLGTVLSFCGIGGLAISLLSKGVFVNLIGSLTLYLTQPFTLGDWIQTIDGELDGWVQSMGPYHTVVMRWDRRPLYIPNSKFLQMEIINASRMTNRRILMDIPVRMADLPKVDSILYDINELLQNHKALDPDCHRIVRLRSIGSYAAMIWLSCYTKGINLKDYVDAREDIILGIKNIMFKYGTTFANSLERHPEGVATNADVQDIDEQSFSSDVSFSQSSTTPLEGTQKAMLADELRSLKQRQEQLWEKERRLKQLEQSLQNDFGQLNSSRSSLEEQELRLDREKQELEGGYAELSTRELQLAKEEDSIASSMEDLKIREDALYQLFRELRAKEPNAVVDEAMTRKREEDIQQADRVIEIHQEMLSQERKALKLERDLLKAQRSALMSRKRTEEDSQNIADAKEPATTKAIAALAAAAESLGGE